MFCPNCETEVPKGSFFCAECGADTVPAGGAGAAADGCRAVPAESPLHRRQEDRPPLPEESRGDEPEGGRAAGNAPESGAPGDPGHPRNPGGAPPAPADGLVPSCREEAADPEEAADARPPGADCAIAGESSAGNEDGREEGPVSPDAGGKRGGPGLFDEELSLFYEEPEDGPAEPRPRRRRVAMPYDPMEDLNAEYASSPRNPPAQADGDRPYRRVPLPAIAVLAATVLVLIAAALFVGGAFGGDGGLPAGSPAAVEGAGPAAPTASPDAGAVGTESGESVAPGGQVKAFTGSIVLMVTPTFDGYEAVVTGGSRIGEVDRIVITVQDKAGVHTLDWYYPYRGESFILMRGMYGGAASQAERVSAEAYFAGGEKELIWDEKY